jgi:S-adenosylmethionine-dependent methyltransferase
VGFWTISFTSGGHQGTRCAIAGLTGPLRVINVGGGDGAESLPLAARDHEVTVLDFAPELLEQAERAAEATGVPGRVWVSAPIWTISSTR